MIVILCFYLQKEFICLWYKGDDIYYSIKIISSTTNNTQKIS